MEGNILLAYGMMLLSLNFVRIQQSEDSEGLTQESKDTIHTYRHPMNLFAVGFAKYLLIA